MTLFIIVFENRGQPRCNSLKVNTTYTFNLIHVLIFTTSKSLMLYLITTQIAKFSMRINTKNNQYSWKLSGIGLL